MTSEDARVGALKRAVAAIVAQTGNAFGFYIHRISVQQELNEVMGFFKVALSSANPVRLAKSGGECLGYLNTLNAGSFSPTAFGQSALPFHIP